MFRKIAWQLTSSYIVVILFSMGILGFYMLQALEEHFIRELEHGVHDQAQLVASTWSGVLEEGHGDRELRRLAQLAQRLSWQNGSRIRVFDVAHRIVVDTGGPEDPLLRERSSLRKAFAGEEEMSTTTDPTNPAVSLVSLSYPVRVRRPSIKQKAGVEETVQGVVYVTRATFYVRQALQGQRELFLVGTVISLLFSGTLSLFLSHYISQPLREITAAAEKMAHGDLTIQVPTAPRNEIGELGEQFNRMARQLDSSTSLLMEEKNKLAAVLSHMADGVLMMDTEREIVVSNPSANEMLEAAPSNGGNGESDSLRSLREGFARALSEGEERRAEVPLARGKVARAIYSPVRSEKGEVLGVVVILHDITELRRLSELKTDFVSNVSHELKTPIASIKGLAEILLDGALQEKDSRRFLVSINREVDRMARLVKDLLNLSKIESGVVRMEKKPFELGSLVEEVTMGFRERAQAQKLRLDVEVGSEPVWALGDRDRVEQVVVNLLENAVRYSPGETTITVRAYPVDDLTCRVDVRDQGTGIPSADLERIFDRFYRVDKARSREQGGTGLGLSIARQIVDRLQGRIWATSTGKGSTFSFTLPRPISSRPASDPASRAQQARDASPSRPPDAGPIPSEGERA